jgi:hypothetical protein
MCGSTPGCETKMKSSKTRRSELLSVRCGGNNVPLTLAVLSVC